MVKATIVPVGISGNNHDSLRCLTAAMNSGAPVRIGGGIGLWSSIMGNGGDGRGRDSSETRRQLQLSMGIMDLRVGMNSFEFRPNDIQRASPESGSSQNCYHQLPFQNNIILE